MSKDTPKYNKLAPKNAREQGSKLLKENGSDISESVSEKACKRGQARGQTDCAKPRTAKRNKIL